MARRVSDVTATLEAPELAAVPGAYPVPAGRGRWRLTLHRRLFASTGTWEKSLITELPRARGRRLEQKWNAPAQLVFTLNGRDPEAALIAELQHDVMAWRWDDTVGADRPMFRGVIGQAEDQLTADSHVVTFTCHDYLAMLGRRFNTQTLTWTAADQDDIVNAFINSAGSGAVSSAGASFMPGSYLPLARQLCNPDGTIRGLSGVARARTYTGQTNLGTALSQLAAVISGFDYDVLPLGMADHETDALRVFYPQQGIVRTDPVLAYGSNVAAVTRALNSDEYANYVRVLGNNPSGNTSSGQLYAEASNTDATGVVVGYWPYADQAADVTVGLTLTQQAQGDLAYYATLLPSYTLTLTPNTYYLGLVNMGDTVPLTIYSGRLAVNKSPVRVVGLTYDVGEDGNENVGVTVGRPTQSLTTLLGKAAADVAALARR